MLQVRFRGVPVLSWDLSADAHGTGRGNLTLLFKVLWPGALPAGGHVQPQRDPEFHRLVVQLCQHLVGKLLLPSQPAFQ